MMRVAAAVFAGAMAVSMAVTSLSSPAAAGPISLVALDPFLVDTGKLDNIGLSKFLAGSPTLANYAALNLSADGASAAIALAETDSASAVTFSVSGPATLLPYSNAFLTHAPAAGTQSLTVSGAALLHINGHYYAPALVQGPLSGFSSPTAISLTAAQKSATARYDLNLVVPPVVLVHGLWGDKTSLALVEAYLDANQPWMSQANLVAPICYSQFLAFDAKSDPLTNGTNPCEATSHAALQSEIDGLLAEMDSEHTVGGRVDIIAHSMGGLVARSYASRAKYVSTRNRGLGRFHTVVTLDTPEIGSLLANFLILHRFDTRRAPLTTLPGFVWSQFCGSADVETCFDANGLPLSAPTLPISTGAVYSLEPGSPSLANPGLSGPNIVNATWRAISATAPKDGALAFGLNALVAALYPNPNALTVPTVTSILDDLPNDAVVSVASQTQGAQANQFYTFANLSHTSLTGTILTLLSGYNDDSVVDDPSLGTYKLSACWLETSGAEACKPAQAEIAAGATARPIPPSLVDRIRVQIPPSAELGKSVQITLRMLSPGSIRALSVYQLGEMGRIPPQRAAVLHRQGDYVSFEVAPRLLGPVTFGVRAQFSDGTVSVRRANITVEPPHSAPQSFQANDLPVLVLTLNTDTQVSMPHPFAVYAAPVGRVDLNSRFVRYRVIAQPEKPVVEVARNGLMRALAPGEATVGAQFGSATATVRVLVRTSQQ